MSGSCISAHFYRLGEGSLVCFFALIGGILGFLAGFLTWNPLYLGLVSAKPVVWLPGKFGFGVVASVGSSRFSCLAVRRRAAGSSAQESGNPAESIVRKFSSSAGLHGSAD
jgi:uncharacterized protein